METWYGPAALGVVFGLTAASNVVRARFSTLGRLVHAAQKAPRTSAGAVADGATIKLEGTVRLADEVLVAPFSERRCCCYTTELRRSMVADRGPHVETMGQAEEARSFLLEDEAGAAFIEVGPATRMVVMLRRVWRSHAHAWDLWEWALAPGDTVEVFGHARWERDRDPGATACVGYRDSPRRLVVDAAVILGAA